MRRILWSLLCGVVVFGVGACGPHPDVQLEAPADVQSAVRAAFDTY
ncbi:hypothetical protein [Amycolatopsis arida]|nr:hypothetical protein [Amycolatopsis arida]